MVSYTRARAEALGVECKVGIASRAVRVVILVDRAGLRQGRSLGDFELLAPAVYVLAVLSVITDAAAHLPRARRPLTAASPTRVTAAQPRRVGLVAETSEKGTFDLEHQRQRRRRHQRRLDQRRRALPARQGPRRHHRRGQLRELVRPGRPPLRRRRPERARPRPDARRPRRLPRRATSSSRAPSTSTRRRSARTSARRSGPTRTTRSSSPTRSPRSSASPSTAA